jgi:hypothetical protein
MAIYKTTSCQVILRKVMRDLNPPDGDWIDDGVEWIGEALEHIGASTQLVTEGCILEVKDFKAVLPADLYYINQVSINETEGGVSTSSQIDTLKTLLTETIASTTASRNEIANNIQSLTNGTTTSTLSNSQLEANAGLQKASNQTLNEINARLQVLENNYMTEGQTMLAYCTTNFPEALHCEGCVNKQAICKDCYYVEDGYIKTSFANGKVCLSYKAFPTDAECYPLVPDDISYKEAMFWYIYKKMLLGATFDASKNGIDYGYADQQWKYYCTQARNAAVYPDIDRMESFMNQWVRLIPNINRADEGFENLGTRENLYRGNHSGT